MRGFGLQHPFASAPPPPASTLWWILHIGQSLSTGDNGTPPLSTSNVGSNVRLYDSSGTYDVTNASANTLSLTGLVAPMRSDKYGGGGLDTSQYPINIGGESPEIAMANQLATLISGNR